jgi:hypothetical protein
MSRFRAPCQKCSKVREELLNFLPFLSDWLLAKGLPRLEKSRRVFYLFSPTDSLPKVCRGQRRVTEFSTFPLWQTPCQRCAKVREESASFLPFLFDRLFDNGVPRSEKSQRVSYLSSLTDRLLAKSVPRAEKSNWVFYFSSLTYSLPKVCRGQRRVNEFSTFPLWLTPCQKNTDVREVWIGFLPLVSNWLLILRSEKSQCVFYLSILIDRLLAKSVPRSENSQRLFYLFSLM